MPQLSTNQTETAPSIQNGTSSIPVVEKSVPNRTSSSSTAQNLSRRRMMFPTRKYSPKKGLKVGKSAPIKISSLPTARHSSQSLIRMPARNYSLKNVGLMVVGKYVLLIISWVLTRRQLLQMRIRLPARK